MTSSLYVFRGRLVATTLAGALLACAKPEPLLFDVRVEVTRRGGKEPVTGALVRARDEAVMTDARGASLLHVRGQAGDRVPVSLTCPAGSGPSVETEVLLPGAPTASSEEATTLRLACPSASHDAVVLVHAAGSAQGLPVKVDGVVVGQTDSLGFAHVHVRAGSRADFEVSLDTESQPGLTPANPTRHFSIDGADELFVFDTVFDPGSRKARRPTAKRRRPVEPSD